MHDYNEINFSELEYAYCGSTYTRMRGEVLSLYVKYKNYSLINITSHYRNEYYLYKVELDDDSVWSYVFNYHFIAMYKSNITYILLEIEDKYGMSIEDFTCGNISHEN